MWRAVPGLLGSRASRSTVFMGKLRTMTIASVGKPSGLWKGACGRYGSISPTDEILPAMPDQRPSSPIIDFRSDNTGRAAPEIIAALAAANEGTAAGYGGDEWTALLQRRFGEVFET